MAFPLSLIVKSDSESDNESDVDRHDDDDDHIPHICHESHENSRVNFFWLV